MRKVIIKPFGYSNGTVCDLEQAESLSYDNGIVLFDGISVHSYEDLVRLTSLEKYRNLEFLEVVLLPGIAGG